MSWSIYVGGTERWPTEDAEQVETALQGAALGLVQALREGFGDAVTVALFQSGTQQIQLLQLLDELEAQAPPPEPEPQEAQQGAQEPAQAPEG